MKEKIRINRFLARAGMGSRRKCEELVLEGRVEINGKVTRELWTRVDPDSDRVTLDGSEVRFKRTNTILALNKPSGIISSASDELGRRTVIDLAREKGYGQRLYPVGRLDMDTTGIILLTDFGKFAHRMTHPRFKVEKTYLARVEGRVTAGEAGYLASGIDIGGYITSPCRVSTLESSDRESVLEITLREGRKRQIKRMFEACGHKVAALHRKSIGGLEFEDLDPGDIRPLTSEEKKILTDRLDLIQEERRR